MHLILCLKHFRDKIFMHILLTLLAKLTFLKDHFLKLLFEKLIRKFEIYSVLQLLQYELFLQSSKRDFMGLMKYFIPVLNMDTVFINAISWTLKLFEFR